MTPFLSHMLVAAFTVFVVMALSYVALVVAMWPERPRR